MKDISPFNASLIKQGSYGGIKGWRLVENNPLIETRDGEVIEYSVAPFGRTHVFRARLINETGICNEAYMNGNAVSEDGEDHRLVRSALNYQLSSRCKRILRTG